MARGTTRAPSHNAYRGQLGKTQTTTVHVAGPRGELVAAQVYTTIDAVSDPELVDRLHSDDPSRALNTLRFEGGDVVRVPVPVVYHDPAAELLVLILGDAHRHRELDERIRVLESLRAGDATVPAYAKSFAVVYGTNGLRAYLEERAQQALEAARTLEGSRDAERRRQDLAAREGELERARAEHDKRVRDIERRAIELDIAKAELVAKMGEVERVRADIERFKSQARNRVIAAVQTQPAPVAAGGIDGEATSIGPAPTREISAITMPVPREVLEEVSSEILTSATPPPTNGHNDDDVEMSFDVESGVIAALDNLESREEPIIPPGADPLTTETTDLPPEGAGETWLERALQSTSSMFAIDAHGSVRLALVVGEQLVRGFGGQVDLRVLLHRTPWYPVIAVVVGPPAALRVPSPMQLVTVTLDIAAERDRQVLASLAKRFEIIVDVIARKQRVRRLRLTAPLAENVGYIVRAAEDHLRGVQAEGEPSFARARELVQGAGYDLLGLDRRDTAEFRDDKLAQLGTAQQLRRAIAMARRFARPSREDYLVCTRGFPLPRWRELRRHVLDSAVSWGLWMGPELAQVAVSEGLARSRRDLVQRLDRGFDMLKRHPTAFDIDDDATADNEKALAEEARALGVELGQRTNGSGIKTSDEGSQ
ncbi:MAG TPA: hypothetical protein VK427_12040, partial [Kofleriaceae bacterium]|nr:hypothetical protein [Kofleriaceae bacterium]